MNLLEKVVEIELQQKQEREKKIELEAQAEVKKTEVEFAKGRIFSHSKRRSKVTIMASHDDGTCSVIDNRTGRRIRARKENLKPLGNV